MLSTPTALRTAEPDELPGKLASSSDGEFEIRDLVWLCIPTVLKRKLSQDF
jgi:hypothetical protein